MSTILAPRSLAQASFLTPNGVVTLQFFQSGIIFLLGRNGTGKSALVHRLSSQLRNAAVYIPGARPSYFDAENLSLTPSSRLQLETNIYAWDALGEARWRSNSGSSRNEKSIYDLQSAEVKFRVRAADDLRNDATVQTAVHRIRSSTSPFDRVNALLAQANLATRIVLSEAELKAVQNGQVYSVARMSDGERVALLLAAEVVAARSGVVFIIDEPELHLHQSIVVPLLASLIADRPDCSFVVSTHELQLPLEFPNARHLLVRRSEWMNGDVSRWDVDLLENASAIPEDLRVDILGARRKLLFIEGCDTSLDQPLYALLFPDVSVRTRASCREVMQAVTGLRGVENVHHTRAFGIVDNDGVPPATAAEWEQRGTYALSVFSVESLYYSTQAISAVAALQATVHRQEAAQLIREAEAAGLNAFREPTRAEYLAARRCERRLREAALNRLPTRADIQNAVAHEINVVVPTGYHAEVLRYNELVAAGAVYELIRRYPARESGALSQIARALRFRDRADYESAVLGLVERDLLLRNALKAELSRLSEALSA